MTIIYLLLTLIGVSNITKVTERPQQILTTYE